MKISDTDPNGDLLPGGQPPAPSYWRAEAQRQRAELSWAKAELAYYRLSYWCVAGLAVAGWLLAVALAWGLPK